MEAESAIQQARRKTTRRSSKGAGYIFRQGNSWFVRYRDWRMVDGKVQRVQVCHKLADVEAGYRSKKPPQDVKDRAAEHLGPIKASSKKPESTQLLDAFVEVNFLPYMEQQVRPSTFCGYEARWRQLKPWCLGLRLRDTDTGDVQLILERLAQQTALSRSSIRSLRNLLSGAFGYAIRTGVMPKGFANPVREVKLPNAKPGKETHAYSLEEVQKMLAILPEPARTAVAVAAYTGLRRGEIRGLCWENYREIEFDDGQRGYALQVLHSVWNGIATEPKTQKSQAHVPVIAPLARVLETHRLRSGDRSAGPIFVNSSGKSLDMNNLLDRQILPALVKCAGCGESRSRHKKSDHPFELDASMPAWHGWHAFRRGLATNLHRLSVPDKHIQQLLRHANVAVTQACYIKTVTADSAAAMRRLEMQLSGAIQ